MKRHEHKVKSTSDPLPFVGCVNVATHRCNGKAHGSIRYIDTCRCGATRESNVNGPHKESGGWQ